MCGGGALGEVGARGFECKHAYFPDLYHHIHAAFEGPCCTCKFYEVKLGGTGMRARGAGSTPLKIAASARPVRNFCRAVHETVIAVTDGAVISAAKRVFTAYGVWKHVGIAHVEVEVAHRTCTPSPLQQGSSKRLSV